ncbi:tetrapyrrole biosynthesis, uroporphyrinogen III synthase [Athelia psychrophila]|uniref:Tetrapyrrole biosynthesis, uroporphyrinogen III synthase n=1 Tax=Athelia psychrophila TaxID=1759441 RepID=A0A166R7T9_9AGAM|nr:tetrapyrrole biosynthesis, uroporphyrinogen III synthase [Fibularhizoctonia sp. CBS 109695]
MSNNHILFLRSPSDTNDHCDPYESKFREHGFRPVSLPVLETAFVDVDDLRECIAGGPKRYAGVIITSARSCEAWANGLVSTESPGDWSSIPFYVVGAATHKVLSSIPGPRIIRGGAQTGTSERLARFILDDLPRDTRTKPILLYLTGDKNRDTLPNILAEGGVEIQPLKVYETRGSSTFAEDLKGAIEHIHPEAPHWIVFFAPSAAEFVTPILRCFFSLPSLVPLAPEEAISQAKLRKAELATIGPTTRDFLLNTLSLRVAATALKPNSESLVDAILSSGPSEHKTR